jgi:uncharacterized membrane protein YkoI
METRTVAKVAAAGVAGGVLAFAGLNLANAASSASHNQTQGSQAYASAEAPDRGPGHGETPLTGDTAAKVTAAAQAAVPDGTVIRVETDNEGVYEAHVRKADGTEVIVAVDKSFAVTGTTEMPAGGPGAGRHGPGGHEKALKGAKAAKVKASALAEVPGGTVKRVEADRGGAYEAHVTKANGTEVIVEVNKAFKVTDVITMPAPPKDAHTGA